MTPIKVIRINSSDGRKNVRARLAISRKRMTVTHFAASPMPSPIIRCMYMVAGNMIKPMNNVPSRIRQGSLHQNSPVVQRATGSRRVLSEMAPIARP